MFTIHRLATLGAAAAIGLSSVGCVARAGTYAYVEPVETVVAEAPVLVPIGPGIWVVQDSDVAIYYVGGFYWQFRAGLWYRSAYWDADWVIVGAPIVPTVIVHREHRHYVRYHAPADVHVWRAPPAHSRHHRGGRDHDGYREPYRPADYRAPQKPHRPVKRPQHRP